MYIRKCFLKILDKSYMVSKSKMQIEAYCSVWLFSSILKCNTGLYMNLEIIPSLKKLCLLHEISLVYFSILTTHTPHWDILALSFLLCFYNPCASFIFHKRIHNTYSCRTSSGPYLSLLLFHRKTQLFAYSISPSEICNSKEKKKSNK